MRAAIYARVSTVEQTVENQRLELSRYCEARGWTATEYLDEGVSGAKESRPALDRLLKDARRRKVDVVLCWSLDRLGRSLKNLITLLDDLHSLGVGVVTLKEGLDWTTPTGRLQAQLLGIIAEWERARIADRVRLGLSRAKSQGRKLGRPKQSIPVERLATVEALSVRQAAEKLGVSIATISRWRTLRKTSSDSAARRDDFLRDSSPRSCRSALRKTLH